MDNKLERQFIRFHNNNPRVYDELVKLAQQAKEAGRTKVGMRMLFEVLRWHFFIETTDEQFKLCNNHCPYYARLIMEQEPDLDGLFIMRELRPRGTQVTGDVTDDPKAFTLNPYPTTPEEPSISDWTPPDDDPNRRRFSIN